MRALRLDVLLPCPRGSHARAGADVDSEPARHWHRGLQRPYLPRRCRHRNSTMPCGSCRHRALRLPLVRQVARRHCGNHQTHHHHVPALSVAGAPVAGPLPLLPAPKPECLPGTGRGATRPRAPPAHCQPPGQGPCRTQVPLESHSDSHYNGILQVEVVGWCPLHPERPARRRAPLPKVQVLPPSEWAPPHRRTRTHTQRPRGCCTRHCRRCCSNRSSQGAIGWSIWAGSRRPRPVGGG
jgi:hypothetical protein